MGIRAACNPLGKEGTGEQEMKSTARSAENEADECRGKKIKSVGDVGEKVRSMGMREGKYNQLGRKHDQKMKSTKIKDIGVRTAKSSQKLYEHPGMGRGGKKKAGRWVKNEDR